MYRVNNDKRVRQSAELIGTGLMKCLKDKPLSKINISEICTESNISRATFYRIFDTPTDVLTFLCDDLADEMLARYQNSGINDSDSLSLFILEFWMEHSDILESIIKSGRHTVLQTSFEKCHEKITPSGKYGLNETQLQYLRVTLAAILCSILLVWSRRGKKETAQELFDLYRGFSQYSER